MTEIKIFGLLLVIAFAVSLTSVALGGVTGWDPDRIARTLYGGVIGYLLIRLELEKENR